MAKGKDKKSDKSKDKKSDKSNDKKEKKEKSLKANKIDWSKYPEGTTEINNPNFYFGTDKFIFKNGDRYVGEYCAHKCGLVWREGKGLYVTKDGHSYEGFWENDQLLSSEQTIIKYPDGTEYRGPVKQGMYSGVGTYIPHKNVEITLNLEDNVAFGEVILTDNKQNLWKGNVNPNSTDVLLLPENHFFTNLSYDIGVGRLISSSLRKFESYVMQPSVSVTETTKPLTAEKLKNMVFKKSTKTPNHFRDKVTIPNNKFKFSEKDKADDVDATPTQRIPKARPSLLKARSGSNASLWNKFVKQNIELAQGKNATTIMHPTVDEEQREDGQILPDSSKSTLSNDVL